VGKRSGLQKAKRRAHRVDYFLRKGNGPCRGICKGKSSLLRDKTPKNEKKFQIGPSLAQKKACSKKYLKEKNRIPECVAKGFLGESKGPIRIT